MKNKVFLTGACGSMGIQGLKMMVKDPDNYDVLILVRDSEKNRKILKEYLNLPNLEIVWGDLNDYNLVYQCVEKCNLILHVAAFVSPAADYNPKLAMKVNYGSTLNLINAIKEQKRENEVKFVYIGTVAETGDRMPPIHWGRVGDPIKPSMFDYYAVSKVAAERLVIESDLKYWVSLRQTGIIGPAMSAIRDPIMFHNCYDNVLEYVSDRDSGILLRNLSLFDSTGKLDESFWCHIYNIGGGESCRVATKDMFNRLYGDIGIKDLSNVLKPKMQATRNFHGQYYLDSDKLENYLHFRNDSMEYYYDSYKKGLGASATMSKIICKIPGGQKLMGKIMGSMFNKLAEKDHGTVYFIKNNLEDKIEAYWGSKEKWEEIPENYNDLVHFDKWNDVVFLNHGFDESKPESELCIDDIKDAAKFRGGECLSETMNKGDWASKLTFKCAFGHKFKASPRLILEGGHWCDECERKSWNYGNRAKVDPFFSQVWTPLHDKNETREYKKIVSELDYTKI